MNTKTIETLEIAKSTFHSNVLDDTKFECAVYLNGRYTRIFDIFGDYAVKMNDGRKSIKLGKIISKQVVEFALNHIEEMK